MKKKRSKASAIFIVLLIMAILFGVYNIIAGVIRSKKNSDIQQSEIQKLLEKEINESYPATPREVVKLYSRYTKCIYNEKLSDDEISKLAEKVQMLYDAELLQNNPFDEYLYDLKLDISEYHNSERRITSYSVDSGDNVVTWTDDGKEYARLVASYTLREDSAYNKTFEEFLLRKDEENRWKILGFRLTDSEDLK